MKVIKEEEFRVHLNETLETVTNDAEEALVFRGRNAEHVVVMSLVEYTLLRKGVDLTVLDELEK